VWFSRQFLPAVSERLAETARVLLHAEGKASGSGAFYMHTPGRSSFFRAQIIACGIEDPRETVLGESWDVKKVVFVVTESRPASRLIARRPCRRFLALD